ncbi:MAG TPA: Na-translocating system protein MpsC family protein [Solirubrobacteraceae bacterium]|jgi:uncharacterized protein YbcI|nr:Na-translocating system protein MpsC family protein [Solirubrobacteraceae bacterium]
MTELRELDDVSEVTTVPDHAHDEHGTVLAAISRRIVALLKEYHGKGPEKARTYHSGDLVVVLMSGGYTAVEKTLLADGKTEAVMEQRAVFQDVMRPRFKRVVEEEMHRGVIAFMSTNHHDPDINAELFILAPPGEDGASEADEDSSDAASVAGDHASGPRA